MPEMPEMPEISTTIDGILPALRAEVKGLHKIISIEERRDFDRINKINRMEDRQVQPSSLL
jgi:hypothetical protein